MPPPGQPGSYAGLSKPLPNPPKGQEWARDASTREWKLVPTTTAAPQGGDAPPPPPPPPTPPSAAAGSPPRRHHEVLPTDTFRGICLRYGVSSISLRRANNMLGDDLKLAPDVLVIPPPQSSDETKNRRPTKPPTNEEKIASLVFKAKLHSKVELACSEARAYLERAGWDVNDAIENVKEDFAWSAATSEEERAGPTAVAMASSTSTLPVGERTPLVE